MMLAESVKDPPHYDPRPDEDDLMIVVTVEMHSARTGKKAHLGTAYIANDTTGDDEVGNYWVKLTKWGSLRDIWKSGRVIGFHRKKRGPWDLLFMALRSIVGRRNP